MSTEVSSLVRKRHYTPLFCRVPSTLQLLPAAFGSWGTTHASTWIYRAMCVYTVANYWIWINNATLWQNKANALHWVTLIRMSRIKEMR